MFVGIRGAWFIFRLILALLKVESMLTRQKKKTQIYTGQHGGT